VSWVRLASSDGIDPLMLLVSRSRFVSLVRLASSGGIDPLMLLVYRASRVSAVRLASAAGIVPFKSLSGKILQQRPNSTQRAGNELIITAFALGRRLHMSHQTTCSKTQHCPIHPASSILCP